MMSIKKFPLYDDDLEEILKNKKTIQEFIPLSGVYILIDINKIVYVGRSIDIMARIKIHIRDSDKTFTHYYIYESFFKTVKEEWLEGELIMNFKPKYNSLLPPNLPFKSIKIIKNEINFPGVQRLIKKIKNNGMKVYRFKKGAFLHTLDVPILLNFLNKGES